LEGVTDFYVNESEELIIIKYDNEHTSEDTIKEFLHKEGAKK
jgi:competence protein ComGF